MPAETPIQLDALLMEALEQPPERRAAFIQHASGGDTRIRHDLESLLQLHAQAGDFLEHPPVALPERTDDAGAGESAGTVIGPYKLLERIGEGGFGSVFMAEQEKPVRRRVALKIIKLGMDTRSVIARFEAERQALAMMDHPCIARVFDAGSTESGRPYFVMELVKGTPITSFCDEQCMTVRQRLELFIQVCQAVQHAHNKGVIHRDLKPSNVLAVRHDGTPTIKVIDFGIAKATGDRLTEKTLFTEFRQLIGTPAYMSPEQAGQSDIDVDTRSDIYSLGVLLYELLTGTTPFDAKSLQSSGYDEMRRVIREVEPPSPSRRLSSLSELRARPSTSSQGSERPIASPSCTDPRRTDSSSITLASVAAQRHSEPMALVRQLNGDLDWIVMSCLEKDRSRRYETASALAADVQRHLTGEPVVAAPASRLYRISKTLRRHRTAASVVLGFLLLVVLALFATSSFWRQAVRARDAESDQRSRAETISAFLKEMFTSAEPTKAKGERVTVREAIDSAARRLENEPLASQPLVEAELRFTIGSTYLAVGAFAQAESHLRAAEAIQARELGNEHRDTLRTRSRLAETLMWISDYSGAAAIAEPTFEAETRVFGPDDSETLQAMVILGRVLWGADSSRFFESESLLRSAVERYERLRGPDHTDTASALDALGEAYQFNSYPEKAEPLHNRALHIHTEKFGEEHPATLYSMYFLAGAISSQSRNEEAEVIWRRVLEKRNRVLGADHVDTLATRQCIALALARQGRNVEAESLYRESLDEHLRVLGPAHINTIHAQRFLADCLDALGKNAEAEILLRDALEAAQKKFGPSHADTSIRVMCELAQQLTKQHKDSEAEQVARQALEYQRRQAPRPNPAELTQSTFALANVLKRRGADDEAMRIERELIEFCVAAAGAPGASAGDVDGAARRLMHATYSELRDPPRALRLSLEANRLTGDKNPYYLRTLAQTYVFTGQSALALETYEKSAALFTQDHPRAMLFNNAASELLFATPESYRRPAEALTFALRANEISGRKNQEFLRTLAQAYARTGDSARATETWNAVVGLSNDGGSRARLLNEAAGDLLSALPNGHCEPRLALNFALACNELSDFKNPKYLDTLALAYHKLGDTTKAIDLQKKAVSLLPIDSSDRVKYEARLNKYQAASRISDPGQ